MLALSQKATRLAEEVDREVLVIEWVYQRMLAWPSYRSERVAIVWRLFVAPASPKK